MTRNRWLFALCLLAFVPRVSAARPVDGRVQPGSTTTSAVTITPVTIDDDVELDWFTIGAGGGASWLDSAVLDDNVLEGTTGQFDAGINNSDALLLVGGYWVPDSDLVATDAGSSGGGGGIGRISADAAHRENTPITEFSLLPITPSPSQGLAQIAWAVPRESRLRLSIHDVQGRQVAVLADGAYPAGRYSVTWNTLGGRGSVSPGMYFVRLQGPDGVRVRRLVLAP